MRIGDGLWRVKRQSGCAGGGGHWGEIGWNKRWTLSPFGLKPLSPYLTTIGEPQTEKQLRTESKDDLSNNTGREEIPPWANPGPVKGRG